MKMHVCLKEKSRKTIHFMRPCVTWVYQKSRIRVVVCDKLQKKTHRMHQVGLLSTFLCDSCTARKSLQFSKKFRNDKLYTIVNSFDKYVQTNINSALIFSFFFLIIKILMKTYFIIKFITNLRRKCIKIHFLTHFFHEQNLYTSYRLFLCTECHLI